MDPRLQKQERSLRFLTIEFFYVVFAYLEFDQARVGEHTIDKEPHSKTIAKKNHTGQLRVLDEARGPLLAISKRPPTEFLFFCLALARCHGATMPRDEESCHSRPLAAKWRVVICTPAPQTRQLFFLMARAASVESVTQSIDSYYLDIHPHVCLLLRREKKRHSV